MITNHKSDFNSMMEQRILDLSCQERDRIPDYTGLKGMNQFSRSVVNADPETHVLPVIVCIPRKYEPETGSRITCLPEFLVPHHRHSRPFILLVLFYYRTRRFGSVLALCQWADISPPTLYRWIRAFMAELDVLERGLIADLLEAQRELSRRFRDYLAKIMGLHRSPARKRSMTPSLPCHTIDPESNWYPS